MNIDISILYGGIIYSFRVQLCSNLKVDRCIGGDRNQADKIRKKTPAHCPLHLQLSLMTTSAQTSIRLSPLWSEPDERLSTETLLSLLNCKWSGHSILYALKLQWRKFHDSQSSLVFYGLLVALSKRWGIFVFIILLQCEVKLKSRLDFHSEN